MAGQYEAELCCAIVEERFGISVSMVLGVILREPNYLPAIIFNLKGQLTSTVVKKSIALLEQFNLIKFKFEPSKKVVYYVDVDAIFALLKAPRCGMVIQKLYGAQGPATDIFLRILYSGRLSCSETIKRVVNQSESLGQPVDAPKVAELFRQIVDAQYLIRCPQVSGYVTIKNKENEKDKETTIGPLFQTPGDLFAFPEQISTEVTSATDKSTSRKRKHADTPDAEIYWRVNFTRFDKYFRDELIHGIVVPKNWTGDEKSAAICRKTLLAFLKCIENRDLASTSSSPISVCFFATIFAIIILWALDITKSAKEHSFGVDKTEIEWALRVLVEESRFVIRKAGDSGGGLYVLDYDHAVRLSCQHHLECLIREQLDTKAVRVFRLLQTKGFLEEEQVEKLTMMSPKETRELLFAMQEEGYVFTKPIGRTQDFAPARTFYLYYVDLTKTVRGLLECTCKALRNIIMRRKKEVADHKYLVDKNTKMEFIIEEIREAEDKDEETKETEIADVKETYMPASDMNKYEKFLAARSMLDKAEVDAERVLMVFRLHLLLSKFYI